MGTKGVIVVLDNNIHTTEKLSKELASVDLEVMTAHDKMELFNLTNKVSVGIILMNLAQDGDDAISICLEIRNRKDKEQPMVVIYSNENEDYIQVAAFSAGVDDFVVMPVSSRVLAARLKALLKRRVVRLEKKQYKKNLIIDFERYEIIKNGKSFHLPKKRFEILNLLLSSPEKVFTRDEIALKLWDNIDVAKLRIIDIHISAIRKRLGNEVIRTVKGIGYCFTG